MEEKKSLKEQNTYLHRDLYGQPEERNVLFTMYLHPPKTTPNPLLYLGFLLVAGGASLVLYFKPQ